MLKQTASLLVITLLSLAAHAELPSLLRGQIGDVYYTDSSVIASGYTFATDRSSYPKVKCSNFSGNNVMEVQPYIKYGFFNYKMDSIFYPAESPWFNQDVTYRLMSPNWYSCDWNSDAVKKDVATKYPELRENIQKFLILDSLSADGTSIRARALYQGAGISKITASGKPEITVAFQLKLEKCQLDDGQTITTFLSDDRSVDLRDIISRLRQRNQRNFQRCDLRISSPVIVGEIAKDGRLEAEGSDLMMTMLGTDRLLYKSHGDRLIEKYYPKNKSPDPAAEMSAMAAAKSFIDFITDDYGDLLFDLSEKKNVPEVEKREAIRGFFETNKEKLQGWFKTIDENYGAVSLNNKVALLISIQDMYKTIGMVETTVSRSNINLDRVIRSYQK